MELLRQEVIRRHAGFSFMLLAVLLAFSPLLYSLSRFANASEHFNYILLIPLVSLYFIIVEREEVFSDLENRWGSGAFFIVIGLAGYTLALLTVDSLNINDYLALGTLSFLLATWGAFLSWYGWDAFRRAGFPLGFLLFMVPFPTALLEQVVYWLQVGSTEVSAIFFGWTGVPFYREGFYFTLPNLLIEVAEECSSIRSSLALLITGVILARTMLRTFWKRALLLLFILPLSVIKNGIRIVTLSLLTIYVDPGFMHGSLHRGGGIVFFVISLLLLAPVLWTLHRSE
ncbi:MAG TPA: exosortase/archaeosortase family protein [Acidobacteriota bacterium]|nr:exosortase/archaeosortase family protein [Acidobacteriota bacterium]